MLKVFDAAGEIEVPEDLGSLNHLKYFCIKAFELETEVPTSIGMLENLETLDLTGWYWRHDIPTNSMEDQSDESDEYIDLDLDLPKLQYLVLDGQLEKLPEWIQKLQNLVKLKLVSSKLTEDSMKLLKSRPNLLSISLMENAYVGETLHFQNEWFKNLKELYLDDLDNLKDILIDQGALPSLKKFNIHSVSVLQLKTIPTGIRHLKKLEDLSISVVGDKFMRNLLLNGGKDHWIFKQVPFVEIKDRRVSL
ncbi:disease resistance protein [Trifolium medium]|uniref:Disease resistance protein n=1 Tax=Trifolium medium TaxID=97028 RepID=A0A392MUK0_9FABA|nr:disease resistance protein [Trifolium medium]